MLLGWNKDVMHSANDALKETALQVETLTEGCEGLVVGGEASSLGDAIGDESRGRDTTFLDHRPDGAVHLVFQPARAGPGLLAGHRQPEP